MARPQAAVGLVRLHLLDPDTTTSRGYLSGDGASGNHSKAVDGSGLTFTGNALEAALAADPTILEDAFAVVELNTGTLVAPTWTPIGTPFLLAPGSGTVLGSGEGAARELSPVAVSALHGLANECMVLPTEVDEDSNTLRYACGIEGNRYLGWQSKGYAEALHPGYWADADVYSVVGHPKAFQPPDWDLEANIAEWVFRDDNSEGPVTLMRIGAFTLTELTTIKFISSADEEHKIYLDGPNMGGVIIDASGDETGYTEKNRWRRRLEPGTYRVAAEMTTVASVGGDGNDSLRFACGTVGTDGTIDTVLLYTSSDTRVHRQFKGDERPGMSPMETVRRLFEDNSTLGVEAADILLDNKSFGDAIDSDDEVPEPEHCREWVWPLGTSMSSVLADMSEDADFDLSPDFEFGCWLDRGTDVSGTVALVPGADPPTATMNILDYSWESEPRGPNGYLTLSQDGYDLLAPTITDGSRRVLGNFETGASASIGRARNNAQAAIRQNGRIRRYYTAKVVAVAGAVPYSNFTLCDVVSGRDYRNQALDLEVTDVAWEQGDGTTLFTLSLGEL